MVSILSIVISMVVSILSMALLISMAGLI
jgi:hypothetical protein